MGAVTSIQWTDSSWNCIRGCSRVSSGCGGPGPHGGCYAEAIAARFSGPGMPYEGLAKMVTRPDGGKEARWTGEVRFIEERLTDPLRWVKPRRIFVNSMSDLFHEKIPDEWIDRVFAVMALAPQHTFQVLTKRPERMRDYFNGPYPNGDGVMARIAEATFEFAPHTVPKAPKLPPYLHTRPVGPSIGGDDNNPEFGWRRFLNVGPLPNVWLGVSAEDQATADERIPLLLDTPAAIRFVSLEPLLGPIDLAGLGIATGIHHHPDNDRSTPEKRAALAALIHAATKQLGPALDWAIIGGESGPNARPMNPQWARDLRDQCVAAGVAFFHKQNGEFASVSEVEGPGAHHTFPDHRTVRRVGKKAAGRLLDGREWSEFPEARP